MAVVELRRRELRPGALPKVCMICGRSATTIRRKKFSWHPPWVIVLALLGLFPYFIVALALTKSNSVDVPMCHRHRRYWGTRFLLFFASFVLMLVLCTLTSFLANYASESKYRPLTGFICLGALGWIFVWFFTVFAIQHVSLRPVEITDKSVTLKNVCDEFRLAVEDLRDQREQLRDGEPAPRRRSRSRDIPEGDTGPTSLPNSFRSKRDDDF